ncbi:putative gustatory receptor clone PTE01 [Nannospalax galili]|uniref:putative gustatory receptor clone PTE01 n=1 Tax=Nannospalax galili TaxID=1026970 RepID=UPI00111C3F03|nr:putative gustatory receptor clone PTE01 [Nannospalax galili]
MKAGLRGTKYFPFIYLLLFGKRCPRNTELQNLTADSEFVLLSLSEDPELKPVIFGLFLFLYLITVLGNLLIILTVISDSHLHTPMYFFLCNLSFADICFVSTTVPKLILDIENHSRAISHVGCLTQMSLFMFFGCIDDMLLTVMAYDRFVSICHPLHYTVIMNHRLCVLLILVSILFSVVNSQAHNFIALQITYFKVVEISNFYCDPAELLNLACSDTSSINVSRYILATIYGIFPILGILFSYYKIVSAILKISGSGAKYKTFSTCGSHLSVVCLFYGTATGVYFASSLSHSPRNGLVASVIYAVVTPMLNPFIYTLRNKDFKDSLNRLCHRHSIS